MKITSIKHTGTDLKDFLDSTTCGSILTAHTKCQIAVRFAPTAKGKRSATLSVYDQSYNSPQVIYLNGTGI